MSDYHKYRKQEEALAHAQSTRASDAERDQAIAQIVERAITAGKGIPDFEGIRADFRRIAKTLLRYSAPGARAWADWKVEEVRRQLLGQNDASDGAKQA
jgi:hypothetical protein